MRWLRFATVAVMVFSWTATGEAQIGFDPVGSTVDLDVSVGWLNTGIQINAGDQLLFLAEGWQRVSPVVSGQPSNYTDPDGMGGNIADPYRPYSQAGLGALIGRIGEGGAMFFIGRVSFILAQTSGELWLTSNDGFPGDNTGYYVVHVYQNNYLATGLFGPAELPSREDVTLSKNAPNPFESATTIEFRLTRPSAVELDIFDVSGRHVRTLSRQWTEAGAHRVEWDGGTDAGSPAGAGVYAYRLVADGRVITRTMTLVR